MKKILLLISLLVLSLFAADGRALSVKCVACHGANFEKVALGKSAIVYGQSASDIYGSLIGYKQGTRNTAGMGALMKGQVASMSNNDMWAVAEYIASLSEEAAPVAEEAPADDWPYACEQPDISQYGSGTRYFGVASSQQFPWIAADGQTIKIDRKNKVITVWTVWLAIPNERQASINNYGYKYNNFGYFKQLMTIDYKNMRSKTIASTDYECNGNVIASLQGSNTWAQIVPDSVMEGMTKRIMQKYNLK